jgi:hypothetical protein
MVSMIISSHFSHSANQTVRQVDCKNPRYSSGGRLVFSCAWDFRNAYTSIMVSVTVKPCCYNVPGTNVSACGAAHFLFIPEYCEKVAQVGARICVVS